MDVAVAHDAYLIQYEDGTCLAQLCDLPGCFARSNSVEDALRRLEAALPGYYEWLRRHDDYTPVVQGPFVVTLAETQQSSPGEGAFFTPDAAPVSAEDFDWYLALLEWASSDLVAFAQARPDALPGRPGDDGHASRDLLLGAGARLVESLNHLLDQPDDAIRQVAADSTSLDWLDHAVQLVVARVRAASEQERARIVEWNGSRWSLRRVLRESILNLRMRLALLEAHSAS